MENIKHLEEEIWQLDLKVDNENEFIAPYLIKAGEDYIVVDVGPTCGIPELEKQLKFLGVNKDNLKYVFLTHIHLDHSGGLGTLLKNFPNTMVLVHRRGVPHLIDPEKVLWQSSLDTLGWVAEMYQKPEPVDEKNIISINDKSFEINVNGTDFIWYETPGHASHHFSFMMLKNRIMFCGDSAGMFIPGLNDAMVPTTPHPYRIESGIDSINIMIQQKPEKLAFAHHAIRPNAEMLLKKHIDQLQAWEICVRNCVKNGINDEEDIAVELSGVDEEAGRLFRQSEDFGGLRKALVGSITGFIHLVNQE
jgi:glyoxylase-like metal-dependent hydrolase (beta-lactamase superfamily II)|tara:strand:- start:39847 stop:40764 length:918 start_codon:yes stop_codon:yes gene_type:complete